MNSISADVKVAIIDAQPFQGPHYEGCPGVVMQVMLPRGGPNKETETIAAKSSKFDIEFTEFDMSRN